MESSREGNDAMVDVDPLTTAAGRPPSYPAELEKDVVLRDGARVRVRPIRPDDDRRLVALHARLSMRSAYQRFFTVMKRLPRDRAALLAHVDYVKRMALVAERGGGEGSEVIGVARYEGAGGEDLPEVALVVQDEWQGLGLGAILLESILRAGERRGLHRFRAFVLADNDRMLRLLARHTDVKQRTTEQGVVTVIFEPRARSNCVTG